VEDGFTNLAKNTHGLLQVKWKMRLLLRSTGLQGKQENTVDFPTKAECHIYASTIHFTLIHKLRVTKNYAIPGENLGHIAGTLIMS
jgi:hypothetical protein